MTHAKYKAFTLVELIVVVTILAILATIGFVSYSSYLTGVRDTNRIAQLVSISDGLELYKTKNDLPIPDNNVEIKVTDETIIYQGYAGLNTLETIDFTKGGKDPKDDQFFTYVLTKDKKRSQVMALLEESQGGINTISTASRPPVFYGEKVGIYTDIEDNPIHSNGNIETFELDILSEEYRLWITESSYITGTGGYLRDFTNLVSSKKNVLENDINGIVHFDPDIDDEELFQNFVVENIGDIQLETSDKGKGIICDGNGRLIVGSGSTLLGGRDEFLVYISYKAEKGDNTSYNIPLASWGTTGGYNMKVQHDFVADINNPTTSINPQNLDDGSSIGGAGDIKYGFYTKLLLSAKDGKWFAAQDRKIIGEGDITGDIRSDRLEGMSICSRPLGGYNFKGIIDKVYVSKNGIDKKGMEAFYSLMN